MIHFQNQAHMIWQWFKRLYEH